MKVVVVIDVFRAFTTASYVLDRQPLTYMLALRQTVVDELATRHMHSLVIGKPEKGTNSHIYHIPNSPTRVLEAEVKDRNIIHRTEAGAKGILQAQEATIILAASFVNASATVRYIKALKDYDVTIVPMGHEGSTPSLEDDICSDYITALINNQKRDLAHYIPQLKEGSGKYFFSTDQWQYPHEDFDRCLEVDRFNFAIQATIHENYAVLKKCY
ncbi:MAG: 2-phosphosulfolactate phosphatase [Rhabdochlamydiaceae bacterium]|nr:2-phosphosulfolactate phosphatase [Rhabdochlamydiaceae bacterium]